MEDALVGALGEELQGSLHAIVGSARTMAHHDGRLSAEQRAALLTRITDEAGRLERLAANLVAVTRPSGHPAVTADVADVVQRVVADATSRSQPRRVRTGLGTGLRVTMDPVSLHTVVANLVANGLRFAAPGSRVDVRAAWAGAGVHLTVSNVGPPVPVEQRQRVFEPFVAGVTPADPAPGAGYGLYVVRCLVEAHDGEVGLDSTPDGVTVDVRLPAADRVAVAARPAAATSGSGSRPSGR